MTYGTSHIASSTIFIYKFFEFLLIDDEKVIGRGSKKYNYVGKYSIDIVVMSLMICSVYTIRMIRPLMCFDCEICKILGEVLLECNG